MSRYGGRERGERWDSERFEIERDRNRFGTETRERFEEHDSRFPRGGGYAVDDVYERERYGPRGGYEDDRFERREYYDDEPRYARERSTGRDRGRSITFEKEREREYYSPPRYEAPPRPGIIRRQSSLDTFDRGPLARFREREEYGPPARIYREEVRAPPPPPLTPIPLPRTRGLPPPRRYAERDYEDIRIAEPDYYGDDEFRGYPERVVEREIIRRRRRSRSRESRSTRESAQSSSSSSSRSASPVSEVAKSEFPKRGKTRMPAKLVSKKAIIDLGYPFEEEGDVIIIQKALGRENIDEVIKLSEDYKASEKAEMSGARSEAGTVIEERVTKEVITAPSPPPGKNLEVAKETKIVETRSPSPRRHHHNNAIIIDAGRPREESTLVERHREVTDISDPMTVGPLALAASNDRHGLRDERAIRAEIRALEAEKEALRAQRRRRRSGRRHSHRVSETDLVLYERDTYDRPGEEITLVKRERLEPEATVRIEKDRKGPPPRLVRAMLATLT